ncbi:[citrate (pro-3S)-lyase] ligase [Streptococcus ovuberis]|uniref:[Citrate [pro-3S]-lyase] ligase n=1 Tax=Streptococcus ovuberis TaxID=1936207 RepID=A0A7X6S0X8_9STRE|nr:[citrate (pro-3S)-lyase] ligase [Streptococcus ovuberis]NKZ20658.1 [citrate (pro-3S)-lyase] ligase [Streptococcus ovuberis]
MTDYTISTIFPLDRKANEKVTQLLTQEGIRRDAHLDYTCAIYDKDELIATGSTFGNTLRCLAVSSHYQGEGLLNLIVSHLMDYQFERGNFHLFLYTKSDTAHFFGDLGFVEIASVDGLISFRENKKTGFHDYLKTLERPTQAPRKVAALVINANPFTLGHQYLVEKASAENDLLHLFIVSEDASLVPFSVRKELVIKGTAHLNNIIYHDSGPYMISQATFPSYFQKDQQAVIESQARLDLEIFRRIAEELDIQHRYVGEEPTSFVTNLYNTVMMEKLPTYGINCHMIPRKTFESGTAISASIARQALKDGNWALLEKLLPETSLQFFASKEAQPIIERLQQEKDVRHY